MEIPIVSICIPTYNQTKYLKRLIYSVINQTFQNYEIVISDDSANLEVLDYIQSLNNSKIVYYQNDKALGSPENWNNAIRKAKGKYVKIMHHDDWFLKPTSLEMFVRNIEEKNLDVFFASSFVEFEDGRKYKHIIKDYHFQKILNKPETLLCTNIIGAPSSVIFKKEITEEFDPNLMWLVDVEYYYRLIKKGYKLGSSEELLVLTFGALNRVTDSCHNNREVEIREFFYCISKHRLSIFRTYRMVYDLMTRLGVVHSSEIKTFKIKSFYRVFLNFMFFLKNRNLIKRIILKLHSILFQHKKTRQSNNLFILNSSIDYRHNWLGDNCKVIGSILGFSNKIGENSYLYKVKIGDFSYMSQRCTIQNATIGKFCSIAQDVSIGLGMHPSKDFVSTHPGFHSLSDLCGYIFTTDQKFEQSKHTDIGNDVWIGANSVILDGVKIGDGAIIAAGSVVTKNVESFTIVAGIPAKKLKDRFEPDQKNILEELKWWDKDVAWLHFNQDKMKNVKNFDRNCLFEY